MGFDMCFDVSLMSLCLNYTGDNITVLFVLQRCLCARRWLIQLFLQVCTRYIAANMAALVPLDSAVLTFTMGPVTLTLLAIFLH